MLPLVHDDVHGGVVVVNVVGGPCVAELREQVGKPAHLCITKPMDAMVIAILPDHGVVAARDRLF